ncbi:beta-lactamase/transpeptidase-like protein [Phaeosphaeriaceae sp. PMI808]|nr:beta-lactamase/transpeptidase-like protein [Phaeosphaeriaceae sp. PMI808]
MMLINTIFFAAVVSAKCYEASFAHPLPELDLNDAVLKRAFTTINTALTTAVAASEFSSTSFSIEITSSKESLWSKHHTARERNASRADIPEVNGDALYRIASITKTFTVLGILYQHEIGSLNLDDTIDKHINELREKQEGTIPWKDITLRSMASQLSGIPSDCVVNSSRRCITEKDLFDVLKSEHPIFAPNMKSTYANVPFDLLGLVSGRLANKTFEKYIEDAILKPLDMSKSTFSVPPDSAGVIPLNYHYWDIDMGIQAPGGGMYSSSKDLSKYLRYVLSNYNSLAGLNWIHPVSPAEGLNSFYGMPWEIFHTDRVLKDSRRTVRFISKGGGCPGYTSSIVLIPDFDLGITVLIAGNSEKMFPIVLEAVSTTLVQAAEEIAIRQLQERYVGTYEMTSPTLNSSVTVVAGTGGLVVNTLILNGTDIFNSAIVTSGNEYRQLVPTFLYRDEKNLRGELWRVVSANKRTENVGSIWDDFCLTNLHSPLYAGSGSINELVFWNKEKDGKYGKVELSAFRVNLTRTKTDDASWGNKQIFLEL